jgi:carbamate kinase
MKSVCVVFSKVVIIAGNAPTVGSLLLPEFWAMELARFQTQPLNEAESHSINRVKCWLTTSIKTGIATGSFNQISSSIHSEHNSRSSQLC